MRFTELVEPPNCIHSLRYSPAKEGVLSLSLPLTLDEIFADARSGYVASAGGAPSDVAATLAKVAQEMDLVAGQTGGAGDVRTAAAQIAGSLDELMGKAGVTVRPAMAELSNQFRSIAAGSEAAGSPALRLLVARTYTLMATELRTSKFSQ